MTLRSADDDGQVTGSSSGNSGRSLSEAPSVKRSFRTLPVLHVLRLAIFAGIVLMISLEAEKVRGRQARIDGDGPLLSDALQFFPTAAGWGAADPVTGARSLLDAQGARIGFVVQTSPQGDGSIGFSGPTNLLLAFDPDGLLIGIEILSSGDTIDHVNAVRKDGRYHRWWIGKHWSEIAESPHVDSVSGATLTSLAMAQAVVTRLGGSAPSLKFPEPMTLADAVRLFPDAARIEPVPDRNGRWSVFNSQDLPIGRMFSTSPTADNIVGYQGPTETLVAVSPEGRVVKMAVRKSYDNAPYVGYLDEDWSWPELFAGLSLSDLGTYDLEAHKVEGVSGATMTSMAVARGVIAMAQAAERPPRETAPSPQSLPIRMTSRQSGTVIIIACGCVIALSRLRGMTWVRVPYQLLLIAVVGFWNGDMLSQAMLVGWARHGVPVSSALPLVLLAAAAFAFPSIGRRNVYCSHLCPHGALQQLLRPRGRRRGHLSPKTTRILAMIPVGLLGLVVVVAVTGLPINLVAIEPFDAYLLRIAGWGTLAVAVVGVIASLFIPMAYCRFGCPTGALLDHTRRHSRSERWSRKDTFFAALLGFAVLWHWLA